MKVVLKILGLVAVVLILLQMVPVERTNPPVESRFSAPAEVQEVLKRACYDCHSHETRWPWYSRIAPFSWIIVGHVKEGRKELNFSRWNRYSVRKQRRKLEQIPEEIFSDHMPPRSYLWLHPEARLTPTEKGNIENWVNFVLANQIPEEGRDEDKSLK